MTEQRSVTIGRDAQGNLIVTGDNNRVFVFFKEPTAALLAQLESGVLKPEALPEAVPLPTLVLRIASATDPAQWTVAADYPGVDSTTWTRPAPWEAVPGFATALDRFWTLSRRVLEQDPERQTLAAQAILLGEALSAILDEPARATLERQGRQPGPPPMLIIESAESFLLALPWELLRLAGDFAVQAGRLDIARCVPNDAAPGLEAPTAPVTLLINVSAPTDSDLDYEGETYYLTGVTSRARPWFRRRVEAGWMGVGSGCWHRGAPFRFGCDGS